MSEAVVVTIQPSPIWLFASNHSRVRHVADGRRLVYREALIGGALPGRRLANLQYSYCGLRILTAPAMRERVRFQSISERTAEARLRRMGQLPVCIRCEEAFNIVLDYGYPYPGGTYTPGQTSLRRE